jgi:hypothetical protein
VTVQPTELEIRRRIGQLVESVEHDQARSQELFHYVWTMMCVRQGLLRLTREETVHGRERLVLEEVRTGRQRVVLRPVGLDRDIESLAIQALARIMGVMKVAS